MYSLLMNRTGSRVLGFFMKQRMSSCSCHVMRSPRVFRKPLYSFACFLYSINDKEMESWLRVPVTE